MDILVVSDMYIMVVDDWTAIIARGLPSAVKQDSITSTTNVDVVSFFGGAWGVSSSKARQ